MSFYFFFFFFCCCSDVRVRSVGERAAEQQSALVVFRLRVREGARAALDAARWTDGGRKRFAHPPVGSVLHPGVELHQDKDLEES